MIAMKNLATVAIVFSAAATGCASQSAAFNAMSATDHERAARATQGDESLAREHLDAANRLRNEEVAACEGVPDSDRSNGPFARYGSVTDVEVVRDHGVFPKGPLEPVGVSVYMRAEPAMTAQWLGRVIACHSAHLRSAVAARHSGRAGCGVHDLRRLPRHRDVEEPGHRARGGRQGTRARGGHVRPARPRDGRGVDPVASAHPGARGRGTARSRRGRAARTRSPPLALAPRAGRLARLACPR
jgi:hypothetical protein